MSINVENKMDTAELFTAAMRSIGSLMIGLQTTGEAQPIEIDQLSHFLDSLYIMALSKSRRTVGMGDALLRAIHHEHLLQEVERTPENVNECGTSTDHQGLATIEEGGTPTKPAVETSSEGTSLKVSAPPAVAEATTTAKTETLERPTSPSEFLLHGENCSAPGAPADFVKSFNKSAVHHGVAPTGNVRTLQETGHPRGTLMYKPPAHTPLIECLLNHWDNRPRHLAVECPDFMVTLNNTERSQVMNDEARCRVCWKLYGKQGSHPNPCPEPSYCQKCQQHGHHELLCTDVFITKPRFQNPRGGRPFQRRGRF
jgi:hypothetical protein